MSIDDKRRLAAAAFIALLALSVFWPSPAIAINNSAATRSSASTISPSSAAKLRRGTSPSGSSPVLFALVFLHPSAATAPHDFAEAWSLVRATRMRAAQDRCDCRTLHPRWSSRWIWRFADAPVTAWAERVQSSSIQDTIRIANRFGGGMNPPMVVLFFLIAGVAYRSPPLDRLRSSDGVQPSRRRRRRPNRQIRRGPHAPRALARPVPPRPRRRHVFSERPHRRRFCVGRSADASSPSRRCASSRFSVALRRRLARARLSTLDKRRPRLGRIRHDPRGGDGA